MTTLFQNFRFVGRMLAKRPAFSAILVVTTRTW